MERLHLTVRVTRVGQLATFPRAEERATTLHEMLELGSLVKTALAAYELFDDSQHSATRGQRIVWTMINMYHICDHFEPPLTQMQEVRCR